MADIFENAEADLTRKLIDTLWGEWRTVERQIEELNDELAVMFQQVCPIDLSEREAGTARNQ